MQTTNTYLFSPDFINEFYSRLTGNQPVQKGRVDQVFRTSYRFIIYFMKLLRSDSYKMFHSKTLKELFSNQKYPIIFSMLKECGFMKCKKNLNGKEDYQVGEYPKAYKITKKGEELIKGYTYHLSEDEKEKIEKAFTWERDYQKEDEALQFNKKMTEKVELNASMLDLESLIEQKINDIKDEKGWDEFQVRMKVIEAIKVLKEDKRDAYFSKSFYGRMHNSLGRLPKVLRSLFHGNGEKMVGVDGSNFQPFFLMDRFHKYCKQNDIEMTLNEVELSHIIAKEDIYQFLADKCDEYCDVNVSRDEVKEPVLKMINRNHKWEMKKDDVVLRMINYIMSDLYPRFYDFMVDFNTYENMKNYHLSRVAYHVTKHKENRATSYLYAEWETAFMAEVLLRIKYEIGEIPLYTTYDCINVPESYAEQVMVIMEDVSSQMHYTQANFKYEGFTPNVEYKGSSFNQIVREIEEEFDNDDAIDQDEVDKEFERFKMMVT